MLIYLRLLRESFAFALNALRNNKLRTFLSLLGVTIGVFSIIAVLAAVDSLDKSIKDSLSGLGKNTIYLTKYSFGPTKIPRWQRDNFPQTKYNDLDFLQRNIPNIEASAYMIFSGPETIKYEDKALSGVNMVPVSNEFYLVDRLKLDKGRFYNEVESVSGAPVIVLGYTIAQNIFGTTDPIGQQLRVYGRKLTVIGVLTKVGTTLFDTPDEKAYVPANFVRRFNNGGRNGLPSAIIIKPEEGVDMAGFEEILTQKYRLHRGLKVNQLNNFFVNKLSGFVSEVDKIIGVMNLIGWIISGFSLLVGGFGIANIMFVSVKERTSLIGIQKSLGAKNKFILFQFLFEAVILALLGGIIGLIFVGLIVVLASQLPIDFKLVLSLGNILIGVGIAMVIGLLSGIIPAVIASRLDPVEAIRSGN